ncbi:FHA domain-containing protein FhaB/FipA [Schaalia vaccimaxillae]|uniref:FHA domain-containing protein FhaB/FipA n=1 Tax=Schaalia vaccimaxillae TaxID=183916 RepID=UPI0003B74364|nr:FHA domain-containing protein [Schaalia vaccimaxillae]
MTSDLAFTLFRIGFLVLLWLLVLGAVNTLRRDIFGTVVTPRGKGRRDADERRRENRRDRKAAKSKGTTVDAPHNLLLTGGPLVGTVLPLGSAPVLIGRSPACTLVLEDEYASSRHAALTPQPDGWWIEDLSSRNGTYVDDERLLEPRLLKAGDVIRIGQTTLELVK